MRSAPSEQGDYVSEGNCFPLFLVRRLYGWNTLSANVWLPALSELVGITGEEHPVSGVYNAAMQNVPTASQAYTVDQKGGTQWAWLIPFNPSGGAAEIWRLCGNTAVWLRTPDAGQSQHPWAVISDTTISWAQLATLTYAVHPAVENKLRIVCLSMPIHSNAVFLPAKQTPQRSFLICAAAKDIPKKEQEAQIKYRRRFSAAALYYF